MNLLQRISVVCKVEAWHQTILGFVLSRDIVAPRNQVGMFSSGLFLDSVSRVSRVSSNLSRLLSTFLRI